MKKSCLALIVAMLMPMFCMGQSLSKLWKEVESAQEKDLPKSAVTALDKIIDIAQDKNNQTELIKAYITRISVVRDISADSAAAMLPRIESLINKMPEGADKCLWRMVKGWIHAKKRIDFRKTDNEKAIAAFRAASTNPAVLAKASSKTYMPLLDKGNDSKYYGNDMLSVVYPFMAEQLRSIGSEEAKILASEIMHSEIEWYRTNGNRPATMLAKIDSARILDRETTTFYRSILNQYNDLPLSTEAVAWLAEHETNKDAYELILETLKKHPNTLQTNALKNTLAKITRPEIDCHTSYKTILPGKKANIYLNHRNISSAKLSYTRLPYAASDSIYDNLKSKDLAKLAQSEDFQFALQLKHGQPYENMRDTVSMTLPQSGIYIIKIETAEAGSNYQVIHVSNLAVMQLPMPHKKVKISVVNYQNGKPEANAHVKLKHILKNAVTWQDLDTNSDGEIIVESSKNLVEIFASTQEDKALQGISLTRSYEEAWNRPDNNTNISLHTDRAIYRPGQVVKVGGFLYNKEDDSTYVLPETRIDIELFNANHKSIEKAVVKTDELGAFGTEFTLPQECMNGTFRINTGYGSKTFKVEEYKRPKFHVVINEPNFAYTLGDTITLSGEVKTYTGLPLSNTKLYCSSQRIRSRWFYYEDTEVPLTTCDTISTDADGHFALRVILTRPEESRYSFHRYFYTYNINVRATADDGETEESSISLFASNLYAWVDIEIPDVICKEKMPRIIATQSNCMGKAVEGNGRYAITVGKDTIQTGNIAYNLDNQFNFLKSLPSGSYSIHLLPTDDTNWYHCTTKHFSILSLNDSKPIGKEPLQVWQSDESFTYGHPTTVLVGTPLADAWLHYDLIANEKVIDSRIIHLSDTITRFEYTYKPEYNKGIHAQYAIYSNGNLYRKSVIINKPLPDKDLQTHWSSFRDRLQPGSEEKWTLHITKNGKPVNASLLATMYDASLDKFGSHRLPFSLSYDRSFPIHTWISMSNTYFSTSTAKSLNLLEEGMLSFTKPSGELFNYGRAIYKNYVALDGAAPMVFREVAASKKVGSRIEEVYEADAMPAAAEEDLTASTELRTNFNETAFFTSTLKTNAKGEARIEFKLPESITSWNFRALAHTANVDYAFIDTLIVVEKPLMVQANMPRFLRNGDKTMLSVSIINNTERAQSGKAQLSLIDAQTGKQIKLLTQAFSLKAKENTVVDFAVDASAETPLLICKYVGVTKDFSDGEQQYLPVLADLQKTLTTVPFTLTDTQSHSFSLKELDYNPKAVNSTISVEYTGNPAWTAIEALPSTINYQTRCATNLAINYSALAMMRKIMHDNPQIKTLAEEWKKNPQAESPLLALENNPELKQFILSETPWVLESDQARLRLEELLQSEETLTLKQASMLDKLKEMQTASGGWQWFPGMSPSTWLTIDITEMLVRTRNLCPATASELTPMINRAIAFLDKKADDEVKFIKQDKDKVIPTLWMRYLYITAKGQWEKTSTRKYLLNRLAESSTLYDLYDKAMAATVLQATGKEKEANLTLKSLMEYSVSTPEMGRYFDSRRAPMSSSMYRIPTQVAAIEALNAISPNEKGTVSEMKIWLMQSKHTQDWNSPLTATHAIQCMLSGGMLSAPTALPAKLQLTTTGGKSVNINDKATINPFVQIGYVKAQMPTETLGSAPREITVQQSAATIEQPLSYGAVYLQNYLPSSEISASGSEMQLSVTYLRETANGWEPIANGTTLHKGDRIKVRHEIFATRDFDFVTLRDGRAACMEPVSATSGYNWRYYREVEDAATNYFFDQLRKGTHAIEEEYNIDRTGTFTTACPQVQCQYAPEFTARARNFTFKVE